MRPKFLTPYFFVTLVALWVAAGLIWLDSFRVPTVTLTLRLITEEHELPDIRATLLEHATTLSFYDAVLASDAALRDPWKGENPDKRKRGWHTLVRFAPGREASSLMLTARGQDASLNERLARASALALLRDVTRSFPNRKVDLHIVSAPQHAATLIEWPGWLGTAIASGTAVTVLFFLLLAFLDAGLRRGFLRRAREEPLRPISPETFRPQVPTWWGETSGIGSPVQAEKGSSVAQSVPAVKSAVMARAPSAAPAPPNLPVLDIETITPLQGAVARLFKEDIDAQTRAQAVSSEPQTAPPKIEAPQVDLPSQVPATTPHTAEPTPEDYRRRLNELLSGRM